MVKEKTTSNKFLTNQRKRFTIPDLGQKVSKHLKGRETSRLGHGRKAFTIGLNWIGRFFYLAYQTYYFYLKCFKQFKIVVAREKKEAFNPCKFARNNPSKRVPSQVYRLLIHQSTYRYPWWIPNGLSEIRLHLTLEITFSWKHVMIRNICPRNLVPGKSNVVSNRLPGNHILYVPSYKNWSFPIHKILLFIHV